MYSFKVTYRLFSIFLILGFTLSCTEEIAFHNDSFESVLVIEATITNEEKIQSIKVSRTYPFEEEGPSPETGATVQIEFEDGVYQFIELTPGLYQSLEVFKALPSKNYTLIISTNANEVYRSKPETLSTITQIDNLYAKKGSTSNGEEGIQIIVDSYNALGNANYYRYTYEESYKIIAPKWVPDDVIVIDPTWPACSVAIIPKEEEKRVCYVEEKSNTIIQTTTTSLSEDRVQNFVVRALAKTNYKITWRYSVLVHQYVQSKEAFNYYQTLQNFSENDTFFNQTQPGFFNGNIIAENNPDKKVIGFFEVASVSSKRLFFNYDDFYPNEERPDYIAPCYEFAPVQNQGHPTDRCGSLIDGILNNEIVFFNYNPNYMPEIEGPLIMVSRVCGDCTALGSNTIPDYWIE